MTSPRKRNAAALAVAVGASVVLSACGGGGAGPEASTGSTPVAGGEAVYAVDSPFSGFDPNVTPAAQDARALRQMYDSVVYLDENRQPQPWLAESFEASADGTTYVFTMKDGIKFHDGTALDAKAFCFNLDRIKNPATASIFAIGLIGPYESCAADGSTATVKLSTPYAPFLINLSSPFLGIASPTAIEKFGKDQFNINPVGSGPFKFVSYTPNDRIVLEKNTDYAWAPGNAGHKGAAYVDKLTLQIIPDATVRVGSLRNGSVQMIGNVPETEAAAMEKDPTLKFIAQQQSGAPFQLFYNTQKAPFDDPAVRNAVTKAMDIDSAVKALYFGIYDKADSPLSPTTGSYDDSLADLQNFDPEAAKKELDAAGWKVGSDGVRVKNGQRLSVSYLEGAVNREKRQDIAEFVKSNLKDVGAEVNITLQQAAPFQQAVQNSDYDIVGLSLVAADPNVMYSEYHSRFLSSPGRTQFNFARLSNNDVDAKLIAAQQESDQGKRDELYGDLQKTILEEAISVPVYVPTYTAATNGLSGLRFDAEGYPIFFDAYLGK